MKRKSKMTVDQHKEIASLLSIIDKAESRIFAVASGNTARVRSLDTLLKAGRIREIFKSNMEDELTYSHGPSLENCDIYYPRDPK